MSINQTGSNNVASVGGGEAVVHVVEDDGVDLGFIAQQNITGGSSTFNFGSARCTVVSGRGNRINGRAVGGGGGGRNRSAVQGFSLQAEGTVMVNGVAIRGNNVSVQNGVVYVDGVRHRDVQEIADETKATHNNVLRIEIVVAGDAKDVSVGNASLTVNGNIHGNATAPNGTIVCSGDVGGDASAGNGSVKVGGDVGGTATAMNGSVRVQGSVQKRRRLN